MTVAFDAASESIRSASGSATQSWTHTPVGTPKGVIVTVTGGQFDWSHISSVTYGGVAMTKIAGARVTSGELGSSEIFFLGASIPTGAQTVVATLDSNTGNLQQFTCQTFTGSGDTTILDVATLAATQADPQLTLYKLGLEGIAVCVLYSGQDATSSVTSLSGQTRVHDDDRGAWTSYVDRESSASTSDFTIGYTAGSEEAALTAVVISDATISDTLAFDAATESVRTDTSTSGSFNHTPVGTPRGILVFATTGGNVSDIYTGFTYGGVTMTRVAIAQQSNGDEDSCTVAYFLGTGVPSGTQAVAWTLSSGVTQDIQFVAISIVGDFDTKVLDYQTKTSDEGGGSVLTNPRVPTLDHGGKRGLDFGSLFSGTDAVASVTSWIAQTRIHDHDFGSNVTVIDRRLPYQNGLGFLWIVGSEQVGALAVAIGNDDVVTLAPSVVTIPIVAPAPTVVQDRVVTPSPVTIPILTVAPVVYQDIFKTPSPVTIPVVAPAPTIGLDTTLTPSPVTIPVVAPVPANILFDRVLLPDPVAIVVAIPFPYMAFAGRNDVDARTVGTEVIYDTDPALRARTAGVEVIYQAQGNLRAETVGTEVIYMGEGQLRAESVGVEVLYQGAGAARARVVGVEVIYLPAPGRRSAWATFIE